MIWDKLTYDEFGWQGSTTLMFGGKPCQVALEIQCEEDEPISEAQKQSYSQFIKKWQSLEQPMLEALLRYYNEEERFSYGPDDPEENAAWWPEIDTPEAMAQAVTPEMIVVPEGFVHDEGRRIALLFGRSWGGEDLDDNGVAVTFLDEQIDQIGYKDIAF
jgi:hypothetical protein